MSVQFSGHYFCGVISILLTYVSILCRHHHFIPFYLKTGLKHSDSNFIMSGQEHRHRSNGLSGMINTVLPTCFNVFILFPNCNINITIRENFT